MMAGDYRRRGRARVALHFGDRRSASIPMSVIPMYHDGSRQLQDRFGARALADRMVERIVHDVFSQEERAFIESRPMFFLATADADGRPDCSYKGGVPGFVRVVDDHTLAFPSYDGNGMFKSAGNILANPNVGLLFIDFESPKRLRVNGRATIDANDPLRTDCPGAQLIVRVRAEAIFPNCPRYIHRMQIVESSVYAPCPGHVPPVPKWKTYEHFRDVLPPDDAARVRATDEPA
jgi:predicted pyridoxine 5'-phosphate oxidase superfamily flavin-nucleotide-binding protein